MKRSTTNSALQLSAAFAEFETASEKLSGFYRSLEDKVGGLTEELSRSRAEQARELAEKERLAARLASLLEALPAGVVVIDQHGLIQEFNPVASDLLGALSRGDSWQQVVARAFAPRWDDGHDISLVDGRLVNIATQALVGEPGQILLLKEVTETRRLQDQLAHHKRLSAKTEMAAAMAHQIRTPLASALLNTGNLRRARSDEERERAVSRAVKSLRKLERLVDEMLLFARGGSLSVERIAAADFVAAIGTAIAEAFDSRDFSVSVTATVDGAAVHANLSALTSICLNLVDNAQQACHGKGSMSVSARCNGAALEMRFQDSGPGIPEALAGAIFEPFYTTRANGTGLGLAVARAVARAHGGEMQLAPCASGACFVLTLPLVAATASADAAASVTQPAMAGTDRESA